MTRARVSWSQWCFLENMGAPNPMLLWGEFVCGWFPGRIRQVWKMGWQILECKWERASPSSRAANTVFPSSDSHLKSRSHRPLRVQEWQWEWCMHSFPKLYANLWCISFLENGSIALNTYMFFKMLRNVTLLTFLPHRLSGKWFIWEHAQILQERVRMSSKFDFFFKDSI